MTLFSDNGAGTGRIRPLRILCIVLLFLCPLFWAFRGLDMTDTGFVLTNQRLVFSNPAAVSYWFHLWLTNVMGGLVDLVFGGFGILPHKIAAATIFWATGACIVAFYRRHIRLDLILVALTVSMTFSFMGKINIVHYNNLSALLFVAGACLLARGTEEGKSRLFGLSGFVLALNAFARLPNVIGLGLVFVPLLINMFAREETKRFKLRIWNYLAFFAGAALAVGLVMAAMAALGHLEYYFSSIRDLFATPSHDAGAYGLARLIKRPIKDTLLALLFGAPLAAALLFFSVGISLLERRSLRVLVAALLGLAFFALLSLVYPRFSWRDAFRASAGLCYWIVFAVVIDARIDKGLRLASALAACLSIAMNIGSDTGIVVSSYIFPAMFPVLFAFPGLVASGTRAKASPRARAALGALPLTIVSVFAAFSVFAALHDVYRDTSAISRTAEVPQLRLQFTSDARADILENDLPILARYAPPGATLFAYDSLPLLHFALKTQPYLGNPWPVLYDDKYLDVLLRRQERRAPLPVVVLAKRNPRSGVWPKGDALPVASQAVGDFLKRNKYSLEWSDSAFELYLPEALRSFR